MYIGTTIKGRPDHFIILEKGDDAKSVLKLLTERKVKNLIISNEKEDDFLGNIEFQSLFQQIEILHLKDIEIHQSEQLYAFKNLKRFEVVNCTFKTKEPIDFLQFTCLEEVVSVYSKRFVNLFQHPKLKTIMLKNFNEPNFCFPQNNVLETLSIEGSKECDWNTVANFSHLKDLYLISISSLTAISWMTQLPFLKDIELTSCKNIEKCIENLAEVKTLEILFLGYMGDFETLTPLEKLKNLKELTIERGGKLTDKNSVKFLHDIPNLEFSIEMKNCYDGNGND